MLPLEAHAELVDSQAQRAKLYRAVAAATTRAGILRITLKEA